MSAVAGESDQGAKLLFARIGLLWREGVESGRARRAAVWLLLVSVAAGYAVGQSRAGLPTFPSLLLVALAAALSGAVAGLYVLRRAADGLIESPETETVHAAYFGFAGEGDLALHPLIGAREVGRHFPDSQRRWGLVELVVDTEGQRARRLGLTFEDWGRSRRAALASVVGWRSARAWLGLAWLAGGVAVTPFALFGLPAALCASYATEGWGWARSVRPEVEAQFGILGSTEATLVGMQWRRSALGWWGGSEYIVPHMIREWRAQASEHTPASGARDE